jgi:hypothetical protein
MNANTEKIVMGRDPLNVIKNEVKPLPEHVLEKLIEGRERRVQLLDGSSLEQHNNLTPYAYTDVKMVFDNEDDLIRCARLLQWSDERMRERTEPKILWAWIESFREGDAVEFSVAWYEKDFFEKNKDAFMDKEHSSYYAKFGMNTNDIQINHRIL